MSMQHPTTCRICESACGLIATVDPGGRVSLAPDPDHPVSRGMACKKGTSFGRILDGSRRLLHPEVAGAATSWADANRHVGERLRALIDQHGPDAVGLYSGNAVGHSLGGVLGIGALQRGLRTSKHYSCLTLDNSEMFAVAEWVFGHPLETFTADYESADCVVLFGTDPLASQPSQAQSHPWGVRELRDRAAQLWVLDPRPSHTARIAARHLALRPASDLFVLGWLVASALRRGHAGLPGLGPLEQSLSTFTRDRAAKTSGLDPDALDALDSAVATAERPLIWCGLGILLGPHGTLGYWLTLCLQALTGGIGRGKPWQPGGGGRLRRLMRALPLRGRDPSRRSRIGNWPTLLDTVPSATLAEDILTPGPGQLRALIVVGGEPLRALPDSHRARRALEALDLLVTVDIQRSQTGALADVQLPAATWLERDESGAHNGLQRPVPFHRTDRAVVPPRGEARTDWRILTDLCHSASGRLFDSRLLDGLFRAIQPEQLPVQWLGGTAPKTPFPKLAVPELMAALPTLSDPPEGLKLVTTVRPAGAMNHWIRPQKEPTAAMHPEDLAALGLAEGPVTFRTPSGTLTVPVVADGGLARGTVVIPFGTRSNVNTLIGTEPLEPFTGQPVSNGQIVTISTPPACDPG